jgi:serine-type D-Ala-D-Ala carboxypeptidase (penicillin-binding protein 5/6)
MQPAKNSKGFFQLFIITILGLFAALMVLFINQANAINIPDLISPVKSFSRLSFADNIWFPQTKVLGEEKINLTSKAAFFVDIDTGQVLFEQNSHQRLKIASLTKIMTVIMALEHKNFNDSYKVSEAASNMEPDKMYLKPGEVLTLDELLDGVFLLSANDAAEVIAQGTEKRSEFVKEMNDKAAQLGMKDTKLINPTGLEEDDLTQDQSQGEVFIEQYSSAYDVALMSRYAIKRWPHLIDITSKPHIDLPETENHQAYSMDTAINLVESYPGVVGFKTGYTDEAGLTLVTFAKKGGHEILGVLLGATDRRGDAKTLLDYSFAKLGVK